MTPLRIVPGRPPRTAAGPRTGRRPSGRVDSPWGMAQAIPRPAGLLEQEYYRGTSGLRVVYRCCGCDGWIAWCPEIIDERCPCGSTRFRGGYIECDGLYEEYRLLRPLTREERRYLLRLWLTAVPLCVVAACAGVALAAGLAWLIAFLR